MTGQTNSHYGIVEKLGGSGTRLYRAEAARWEVGVARC